VSASATAFWQSPFAGLLCCRPSPQQCARDDGPGSSAAEPLPPLHWESVEPGGLCSAVAPWEAVAAATVDGAPVSAAWPDLWAPRVVRKRRPSCGYAVWVSFAALTPRSGA